MMAVVLNKICIREYSIHKSELQGEIRLRLRKKNPYKLAWVRRKDNVLILSSSEFMNSINNIFIIII